MPTLSFKDRGAAVLIAHCKAIGVDSGSPGQQWQCRNSVAAFIAVKLILNVKYLYQKERHLKK